MLITRTSRLTGTTHKRNIPVDPAQLASWQTDPSRPLVQDAFPDLCAEDREFLMSGITPEEWEAVFGSTDD